MAALQKPENSEIGKHLIQFRQDAVDMLVIAVLASRDNGRTFAIGPNLLLATSSLAFILCVGSC
jgi:hypothetical protein